jgi:hypothetical protein
MPFRFAVCLFALLVFPAVAQSLPADNGTYGGVDNLGRVLSVGEDQVPPPRRERWVGLFYFLWLAQHGNDCPYDITKIVRSHPEAINDSHHPAWGPVQAFHHWGEPLFGYYTSEDAWVMRKHVQMLTDAGVDFLVFDATNSFHYPKPSLTLLAVLDEYQKQGWNVPKIVFYTQSSSGKTIERIYKEIYAKNLYPNLWFHWEGKPLIIGHPEECSDEIKNFFRIKKSQWPTEGKFHDDGFPWMAFERPQHVFKNADGENEVISVSAAQHNGNCIFSSSAFYGNQSNRTRSFHDGKNDPANDAVHYGYNIAEQFGFAVKQDPKILFITGWNEWVAQRFENMAPEIPVGFVDLCDMNNSRDMEPMKDGYGDNYYMQMVGNIRKYKGVAVPQKKSADTAMDIQGGFSQWDNVKTVYRDYINDIAERDTDGYGKLHYTNKTGRNDFDVLKVAADKDNVYFYVQTVKPLTAPDGRWMSLFLRVPVGADNKNWEGYHFVVNRIAPEEKTAILERSTGGWNWTEVAKIPIRFEENHLHLAVPKKCLPIRSQPIQFKWADNYQGDGNIDSFYIDGDAAPIGRLNYVFQP